jgi:hypothetical protein
MSTPDTVYFYGMDSVDVPTPPQVLEFIDWMHTHSRLPMSAEELFRHCQAMAPVFGLSMDEEGRLSVNPCQS